MQQLSDHAVSFKPLITPVDLIQQIPITAITARFVASTRRQIADIIHGRDSRLLVIVGPCSIHDINAALEYAGNVQRAAERFADDLLIVMRVYFEKPRSILGWGGFINDPHLDNSFDMNYGLVTARRLLNDILALQVPTATEFLETSMPRYYGDLICWNAVGARTVTSQIHRQLAASLAMPTGFKNTIDGNIKAAIDGILSARNPHRFVGLSDEGKAAIIEAQGNLNGHVILRGSQRATNYADAIIDETVNLLRQENLPPRLMVDCSHGNSMKNYLQQKIVVDTLVKIRQQNTNALCGVMLESHLVAGHQTLLEGKPLVYGQSITDGCLAWDETMLELEKLASATKPLPPLNIKLEMAEA